jgi:hypothetical protein
VKQEKEKRERAGAKYRLNAKMMKQSEGPEVSDGKAVSISMDWARRYLAAG